MTEKQWEATREALRLMADDYLKRMWESTPSGPTDEAIELWHKIKALREAMYE